MILLPQKFIIVSKCFQFKGWSCKKVPVGVRKRRTATMPEFVCVNTSLYKPNCSINCLMHHIVVNNLVHGVLLEKNRLGLCQFFHETQQFFELFEIPGTSDSLNLNFFRYLDLAFDSEHFQIPATGSSFDSDLF